MAKSPSGIPHKRGATLSLAGTCQLPAGTWSASAALKQPGPGDTMAPVASLAVTLTPPTVAGGPYGILVEHKDTAAQLAWPLGSLVCDVRYQDTSVPPVVLYSPTFVVIVEEEVTSA